jgi:ribonucleoside-diphosphate reductase alpha chain
MMQIETSYMKKVNVNILHVNDSLDKEEVLYERKKQKKDIFLPCRFDVKIDDNRDQLLSDASKAVLKDRYLLEGEDYQMMFARVATHYADDQEHAQRLYDYMSRLWFMPATPVLSNGGTTRGLPISCFLNEVNDNLKSIVETWNENAWLAAAGGGIGTYWGNVRSIGEKVRGNGKTSGIIPFVCVQDSLSLAISQGNLRRGSSAIFLPISHPEIEEFMEIRKPTGGDYNRKALNLHHGVVVTNDFMRAVEEDKPWDLISPANGLVVSTLKARELWIRLLIARIETGEPYIIFIDHVNDAVPETYKKLGLKVKTSNLCSEIMLATGMDHMEKQRTAVCCLSSINIEEYDQWKDDKAFVLDIMRFLDNVLQDFIDNASPEHAKAVYAAKRERSVGLGVMGFHSFLQTKKVPMDSVMAKVWNKKLFAYIRNEADKASKILAVEKGPCLDAVECGLNERFTHKMAIAPTASISIIASNSSPGIEPYAANAYTQKTLSGSFSMHNKNLRKLLIEKGHNTEEVWSSIMKHEGSVQHFDFLTQDEKEVFKTAFEIDQLALVDLAADRTPYVCQATSLNIFLPADVHKKYLHKIHMHAWKRRVKSLYYLRSKSIQRAETGYEKNSASYSIQSNLIKATEEAGMNHQYEECTSCQ